MSDFKGREKKLIYEGGGLKVWVEERQYENGAVISDLHVESKANNDLYIEKGIDHIFTPSGEL